MGFAKLAAAITIPAAAAVAALAAPGTAAADPLPNENPFTIDRTFANVTGYISLDGVRGTLTDKGNDGKSSTYTIVWYQLVNGDYVPRDTDRVTVPDGGSEPFIEYPDINGSVFHANWYQHSLAVG
ncbi:hypothetical protein [Thermomonospora umbrina]|uniref:Uncharacterized protein n=1 Tax=Thermomonospora umbrina TaxID=111806 RepID=A0A3D9SRA6_9ACTN|nr:hypothetical protein [Thermomonospora umbrina]REE98338.1 hypothetical protein DFJ69_3825 [Thermomonospora umbrina]